MGKFSRSKGKKAQAVAIELLKDRDFDVLEGNSGKATEDLWATKDGKLYSVEVKDRKLMDIFRWKKQAREQAKGKPWLLMCHIPSTSTWLIFFQGENPTLWRPKT